MDNQEPINRVTEGPDSAPPSAVRRRQLPVAVAVLALAAALFSLATLRGADSTVSAAPAPTAVDLAAMAQQSPLAVPLYEGLTAQQSAPAAQAAPAQSSQSSSSTSGEKVSVMIMDYKFSPPSLTVEVGDTVTWTNHDSAPHDVVVTDGPEKFKSPTLNKGESFSYTFKKAGKYSYYCSIHPDMKASVTAEGGSTPPPSDEPAPSDPPADDGCVSDEMVGAFLAHVRGAHLAQSPSQQAAEILALDSWIRSHTVWLDTVLAPAIGGDGETVIKEMISRFYAHVDGAHLQTAPSQQVSELLDMDSYLNLHTVWLSGVLEPMTDQATC